MIRYLTLLGAAGLLLAAGCRKDDVISCTPTVSSSLSLKNFSGRNSAATQTFTLALGASQTITTAGGATLTFPANSLLLPTGSPATGTAQVRLRELYTVPDMVLANMPTDIVRQGNMLVSGGEFNIQIWQNAARLRLAVGQAVALQSPVPTAQDTTRQYVWQQPTAVMASDSAGWQLASAQRVQALPGLYRASLPLDSIGWWNLDQFWHAYYSASTARITVKTTATAAGETRVYLRPVGYNGLMKLWPATTAGTDWQREVPIGAELVAVVLQSLNGQLYFGTQRLTTSSGLTISPVVTAVSEAEAVRLIRQL
ncbi:hypothetical protein [Hymenobacter cheonanensis]|uniref:hypothetical protein n=1 Tax=Hymenobacter sp. CA2-7 TaxID=3063993 RepID=UPI0027132231|nr:hypothetical protein [Hymenobacter sp. CA2-7]MDO7884550.1 hypothetical protein [Hymenobacter sp. CA2-7]